MPLLCEVCGRFADVEWHCISQDYADTMECSVSISEGGTGYWLCSDLCHPTAHVLMDDEGDSEGRAARVVGAMVRRLAQAVSAKARKYQRKERGDHG